MNKEYKKFDKRMTAALNFSVSKDETRPSLQGVYNCKDLEALVSTNGYHGTILKCRYSEKLEGLIIGPKTFELIDREYPKFSAAIPDLKKLDRQFDITIEKHHFVSYRTGLPPIASFLIIDGKERIIINGTDEEKDAAEFNVNASFLKPLADGCTYRIRYISGKRLSPILINLDHRSEYYSDFNNFMVIMPIKCGDRND